MSVTALLLGACVTDDESEPIGMEMSELGHHVQLPNDIPFRNPTGFSASRHASGSIDLGNEFFQNLGINGRRCVSCHMPTAGWTITPRDIQIIFELTAGGVFDDGLGFGAMFRLNDGSNSPNADVSTLAKRRTAYSMLLTKGLIRVGLPIPANAEFELIAVDDPYHFASASELSLFRRPLPSANIRALSTVMWDGRETFSGQSIHFDLLDQANGATQGHAQRPTPISDAQRESIVQFQLGLQTTQIWDDSAKHLSSAGAAGGLDALSSEPFYIGINDNFGDPVTGQPFTPIVFDIYDAWQNRSGSGTEAARRAVARGQQLFNTRTLNISGVSGINDEDAFGNPPNVVGTCTTCHDTPNEGNHSVVAPLNIGLVDEARRTPDMPLYTLRNKTTGEIKKVTDPGRALISGKWKHIGRFKGPILRGLAARAPYFHNGAAATLGDAVDFYDSRFGMGLTAQEKSDLVAFLRTL